MIKLTSGRIDLNRCESLLSEFQEFLDQHAEISETGKGSLQDFFKHRLDLVLLIGEIFGPKLSPGYYQYELVILNEFRADYVVCNEKKEKFLFIEFEDAKEHSIFKKKNDARSGISYQWSDRFEHGLSQLIDWQFRIDDYRRSSKMQEHFGADDIEFQGVLIIGRDAFLKKHGTQKRFDWRVRKTVIDSRPIHCLTFDSLYDEMAGRFTNLKGLGAGNLS